MSATVRSGASRNTPTGSIPERRAVPASGAASSAVTWRGLPGTKTKPANAAGRAARKSAPQFRPHNLVRPKIKLRARLSRVPRERISDEPIKKRIDERCQTLDVGPAVDAGLRNQHAVRGKPREPLGRRKVDAEVAKIAVVDADQRRSERERAAHFGFVMDLDQRIHAEAPRFGDHRSRGRIVEQREHHQDRVGAGDPRLGDLAQVDEEVLGQDRPVEFAPGGGEVVERAAEIGAVAQHAERVGDAGIAAGQCRRIGRLAGSLRLTARPLDLEDEARALLRQRRGEAASRRPAPVRAARRAKRRRSGAQLLALRRRDLAEHAFSHGWPR